MPDEKPDEKPDQKGPEPDDAALEAEVSTPESESVSQTSDVEDDELDTDEADEVDDAGEAADTDAGKAVPAGIGATTRAKKAKGPQKAGKGSKRSGNPAKAAAASGASRFRRPKDELRALDDPISARAYRAPRFVLGMLLVVAGIAWTAWYYTQVRAGDGEPGSPAFMVDLERWNYLIGFGLLLVGLVVAAHKSTPLGRGRGVVTGMLGCFLIGLIWICTFYVFTDDLSVVPVMNDLGQFNLVVGIAFMAVGFSFATKWE